MKQIKLRKSNSKKYCLVCGEIMKIEMKGMKGHCIECNQCIYSIEAQKKGRKR
jgi:NADH pyrophosphatase NudC (nudix superfamily)